jgi:hypothetical protein
MLRLVVLDWDSSVLPVDLRSERSRNADRTGASALMRVAGWQEKAGKMGLGTDFHKSL